MTKEQPKDWLIFAIEKKPKSVNKHRDQLHKEYKKVYSERNVEELNAHQNR